MNSSTKALKAILGLSERMYKNGVIVLIFGRLDEGLGEG
jgi:hypothetical protein